MWELLGLTPEQIAEKESYDPKKGQRERDFGDRFGDKIMSALTGINYAKKVGEATKTAYVDKLKDDYGTSLTRYGSVSGGQDLSDLSKLTSTQLEQRLESNRALKDARTQAVTATGRDRTEYMDLTDPDQILSLAATHVRKDKEAEKRQASSEAAALRQEGYARQDALYAHQAQETNAMNAHNANESNKRMAFERELQDARSKQTLQLAMMDRQDRKEDRRIAREDRAADKRQQSIMMLIKGLTQLGAGFSI